MSRTPIGAFACLLVMMAAGNASAAEKFKPFKLKTPDGAEKTLQDVAGKTTLVSFFFPSCIHCNAAAPHLQRITDKYKEQGLSVVWINVVSDQDKQISAFLSRHQVNAPVLTGTSQALLQRDYKLKITPTVFLLNAEGEVLFRQDGYGKGDETVLDAQVGKAVSGTP